MQHTTREVVLETQRHRISGTITLARDGYRSRVSDVLNATERDFVPLTDVTVQPLDGTQPAERHPLLVVNRAHIVFAALADEEPPGPA